MSTDTIQDGWNCYYNATTDRYPRELLVRTLLYFEPADEPRRAIDLGCGAGVETAELLRRGWHVLAIDGQADAIQRVQARVAADQRARLETRFAAFEELRLPSADLIWAGLSLPFCPPHHFAGLWEKIVHALTRGGRFAGDFFGLRNAWADNSSMTFHSQDQVKNLFLPLVIEMFGEEEGIRPSVSQGIQAWHAFTVIARKI
jgi:SAM-dependent methyltransferase